MLVKLELDEKRVWRYSDAAEERGMRLGDYLVARLDQLDAEGEAVARGEAMRHSMWATGEQTRKRVAELVAAGWTDAEIAEDIDRVKAHVQRVRRGLGLKPNR